MIDAAELLKIHVDLLAAPAQPQSDAATVAAEGRAENGRTLAPPQRNMVLAAGKYYVTEAGK